MSSKVLEDLYDIVESRKNSTPEESYTSKLMHKGIDTILKKIGEESTEVVIAGKGESKEELIYESADLLFHLTVLLSYKNIHINSVFDELQRRFQMSGIEEKNSRKK